MLYSKFNENVQTDVLKLSSGWVLRPSVSVLLIFQSDMRSTIGFSVLFRTDGVYLPALHLEMTWQLLAHSSSLMLIIVINVKKLQTHAWRRVKEENSSRLKKRNQDYCNMWKNEKCTRFRERCLSVQFTCQWLQFILNLAGGTKKENWMLPYPG